MTHNPCYYCDNESQIICVRCKKDVCKDHAHYERRQDGHGEWVCEDCHTTSVRWGLIAGIIGIILVIVVIVVGFTMYNNFASETIFP